MILKARVHGKPVRELEEEDVPNVLFMLLQLDWEEFHARGATERARAAARVRRVGERAGGAVAWDEWREEAAAGDWWREEYVARLVRGVGAVRDACVLSDAQQQRALDEAWAALGTPAPVDALAVAWARAWETLERDGVVKRVAALCARVLEHVHTERVCVALRGVAGAEAVRGEARLEMPRAVPHAAPRVAWLDDAYGAGAGAVESEGAAAGALGEWVDAWSTGDTSRVHPVQAYRVARAHARHAAVHALVRDEWVRGVAGDVARHVRRVQSAWARQWIDGSAPFPWTRPVAVESSSFALRSAGTAGTAHAHTVGQRSDAARRVVVHEQPLSAHADVVRDVVERAPCDVDGLLALVDGQRVREANSDAFHDALLAHFADRAAQVDKDEAALWRHVRDVCVAIAPPLCQCVARVLDVPCTAEACASPWATERAALKRCIAHNAALCRALLPRAAHERHAAERVIALLAALRADTARWDAIHLYALHAQRGVLPLRASMADAGGHLSRRVPLLALDSSEVLTEWARVHDDAFAFVGDAAQDGEMVAVRVDAATLPRDAPPWLEEARALAAVACWWTRALDAHASAPTPVWTGAQVGAVHAAVQWCVGRVCGLLRRAVDSLLLRVEPWHDARHQRAPHSLFAPLVLDAPRGELIGDALRAVHAITRLRCVVRDGVDPVLGSATPRASDRMHVLVRVEQHASLAEVWHARRDVPLVVRMDGDEEWDAVRAECDRVRALLADAAEDDNEHVQCAAAALVEACNEQLRDFTREYRRALSGRAKGAAERVEAHAHAAVEKAAVQLDDVLAHTAAGERAVVLAQAVAHSERDAVARGAEEAAAELLLAPDSPAPVHVPRSVALGETARFDVLWDESRWVRDVAAHNACVVGEAVHAMHALLFRLVHPHDVAPRQLCAHLVPLLGEHVDVAAAQPHVLRIARVLSALARAPSSGGGARGNARDVLRDACGALADAIGDADAVARWAGKVLPPCTALLPLAASLAPQHTTSATHARVARVDAAPATTPVGDERVVRVLARVDVAAYVPLLAGAAPLCSALAEYPLQRVLEWAAEPRAVVHPLPPLPHALHAEQMRRHALHDGDARALGAALHGVVLAVQGAVAAELERVDARAAAAVVHAVEASRGRERLAHAEHAHRAALRTLRSMATRLE